MDFTRPCSKEHRILMPENIPYEMYFEVCGIDFGDGPILGIRLSTEIEGFIYATPCTADHYYQDGKPVPEMFDILVRIFEGDMRKAILDDKKR